MKSPPKTGATHRREFRVEPDVTITFGDLPPVLATPWLIRHLEHAALELMQPLLDETELTVGTQIELEHQSPALEGAQVECVARVIFVNGPEITFQIEAREGGRTLARGLHKRRVVQRDRLRRRLASLSQ